ncbi:TIGR02221 family CRISPR-associated protein [Argonema antarcticum]|uniref:TIGR02221 family CRISPR-associated protein n=1 Tax=Argonema antarcticum TaxID=2942763 RepID=UPI002011EAED|nr:TIGR02221 family CRISPR-associated protein [Argonema antarcticum]MCL1471652.1 TIGR02221 family CRISPR-associated protein [Argonema antarcticum A004/B2]
MQLLTFLGKNKYSPASYTWKKKQVQTPTPYVAEAFYELYELVSPGKKIEKVSVFLTPEAREAHWEELNKRLSERVFLKDVPIPSGKSETEVWEIFDAVVGEVEPGAKVLFDITNAFRSIPILVLLAGAFLQKARNVEIQGVYYGAFEANPAEPPIFDLTPAIKLLDWLTATEQFITTGSSIGLGNLLSTIQQDFSSQDRRQIRPPRLLEKLGNSIQDISRSLELIRSMGVLKETAKFQKIPAEELAKEVGYFAKPFELLSEQIQQSYGQFALTDPEKLENSQSALQKQFLLLRWYVKKELGAQAILLAREWVVSAWCVTKGIDDYLDRSKRERMEEELNHTTGKIRIRKPHLTIVTARSSDDLLAVIWLELRDYRNDIAHAEMRRDSADASELQKYVKTQLIQNLERLFPKFAV